MATADYDLMEYKTAAAHAKAVYDDAIQAAADINIKVEPQLWQADYKAKGRNAKFVDTVDYQRSKP